MVAIVTDERRRPERDSAVLDDAQAVAALFKIARSSHLINKVGAWLAAAAVAGLLAVPSGAWWVFQRTGLNWVTQHQYADDLQSLHDTDAAFAKTLADMGRASALMRWQVLNMRRLVNGSLTPEDLLEYCGLSKALGFRGIDCAD